MRKYLYNEAAYTTNANLANALTGITDENGNRYATFKYDATGRAVSSEHAGGAEKVSFTYNANGTTTATDSAGTQGTGTARIYTYQSFQGVLKATVISGGACNACGGTDATLSYDANGNVASRTDFNGNLSCYVSDQTRNLETARLEGVAPGGSCPATLAPAAGSNQRLISSQWHPNWRLLTRQAEPYLITTYVYNGQPDPTNANSILTCAPAAAQANGLPIPVLCKQIAQATTDSSGAAGFSASSASGASATRISTYSYNSNGQVLTADGPRTDVGRYYQLCLLRRRRRE